MQKLVRDYLNELKRKQKKRKRVGTAVVLLMILVIGTVIGGLTQAGVAMTGNAKCGIEEHEHSDGCYEDVLACGQEEGEGHQHGEGCYTTETRLSCGMDEAEGHQHDENCYDEAGNLICGTEEAAGHQHDDSCYTTEEVLTCEQEEGEGHTHSDACYEKELACKKEEHTHTEECYIDKKADVEDSSEWDEQYKDTEWKETWAENLVIAAEAQIGYKESEDNYEVAEDGSHKGYTRYGQFMDDVYADWDAAFVNFCMHYAGKDDINIEASEVFPKETEAVKWYEEFVGADEKNMSYLVAPQGYKPKAGELVFFDRKDETPTFQMGIVSSYDEEKNEIKVIEGNSDNEVKENEYGIKDEDIEENHIFGYLKMDEVEEAYEASEKTAEDDADQKEDVNTEQPQEEIKELTTEVDGTTITLSGPVSSFEEGKEYSIQAEKVENKETIATIEEAIDQVAEEKEKKVENYQAFDIKLMVDGEEVQPLGPVSVKFSGQEVAQSVENEDTEVNVIHVDEDTGEATDMEATATEEKDVVIETEHFSVYVYINLGTNIRGEAKLIVQHWGRNITTIEGSADPATAEDSVYDDGNETINTQKKNNIQIYTDDEISVPNEYYADAQSLSKLYKGNSNYNVKEVWVTTDSDNKLKSDWTEREGVTEKCKINETKKITITQNSILRFIYEPKPVVSNTLQTPVNFYDYNISDGVRRNASGTTSTSGMYLKTEEQGINASDNFDTTGGTAKLGVGQWSSGNLSPWAYNSGRNKDDPVDNSIPHGNANSAKFNGSFLNNGNGKHGGYYDNNNKFRIVQGIVKDRLTTTDKNGQLQFNVAVPKNLFGAQTGKGMNYCSGYNLGFKQDGDTYTLQYVNKGTGENQTQTTQDLTTLHAESGIYTNNFWPLDSEASEHPKTNPVTDQLSGLRLKGWGWKDVSNNRYKYLNNANSSPVTEGDSDDWADHNWHFGMSYAIDFTVGDYTGPMEYYFRGDDDFWLFVDGEKIIDIGGIHGAVGGSVDLRQKMKEKGIWHTGTHTLKVFYMERGGFGSTCFMQFTLPKSEPVQLSSPPTTTYEVEKVWDDNNSPFRPAQIKINLLQQKGDNQPIATNETIVLPIEKKDDQGNVIERIWKYAWDKLPLQTGDDGTIYQYSYSAEEVELPPGYKSELQADGKTLKNTLVYKKVKVVKDWQNEGSAGSKYRPPLGIKVRLYANGEEYRYLDSQTGKETLKEATLNEANNWTYEFADLPEYYDYQLDETTGKYSAKLVEYSVKELDANGNPIEQDGTNGNYAVSYSKVSDGEGQTANLRVTNTLLTTFKILKKGSSTQTSVLEGAVFTLSPYTLAKEDKKNVDEVSLTDMGDNKTKNILDEENDSQETSKPNSLTLSSYIGISNHEGVLMWKKKTSEDINTDNIVVPEESEIIEPGTYLLREIKAPSGFELSTTEWMIIVGDDGKAIIKNTDGSLVESSDNVAENGKVVFIYEFYNNVLYSLPATGGSGIYWYMFGGVLLMAGAMLITYRNKRREVLRS